MNRMLFLAGALALAVLVSSSVVKAEDKDDKEAPIKAFMTKAHGEEGIKDKVTEGYKSEEWANVSKAAKEWVKQAEGLSKMKQPRGGAESWKKMTTAYVKNVKDVAKGAEDKDATAVKGALSKINTSCKACHTAHKGK